MNLCPLGHAEPDNAGPDLVGVPTEAFERLSSTYIIQSLALSLFAAVVPLGGGDLRADLLAVSLERFAFVTADFVCGGTLGDVGPFDLRSEGLRLDMFVEALERALADRMTMRRIIRIPLMPINPHSLLDTADFFFFAFPFLRLRFIALSSSATPFFGARFPLPASFGAGAFVAVLSAEADEIADHYSDAVPSNVDLSKSKPSSLT